MVALDALDAGELCRVMGTFRDGLRSHQQLINRLNVYPVPDGDTGTNMALTLESVVAELDGLRDPGLDDACRAIAHGSLMGARGNSGVILSQLLRGLTDGLNVDHGTPGARDLARALVTADVLARDAVQRPVEGTILTVARGAADGAAPDGRRGRVAGGRGRGGPVRGGRRPGPHPRACCPSSSRPAWSTPAARATCSCSTPCSPSWTAGTCRCRPNCPRWPPAPGPALGRRRGLRRPWPVCGTR